MITVETHAPKKRMIVEVKGIREYSTIRGIYINGLRNFSKVVKFFRDDLIEIDDAEYNDEIIIDFRNDKENNKWMKTWMKKNTK